MNARMQMSMAMQLSSELGRMTQSYNTRLAQLLRAHDVTYPQYAVLDHIRRNGSKAETISQISDAVEVLQPAVTKIVRKFSDRGLLQVSGTEKDRRQKRVSMTAEGAAFIGKLQAALMPDVLVLLMGSLNYVLPHLLNILLTLVLVQLYHLHFWKKQFFQSL